VESFGRAIDLHPDHARAHCNCGNALLALERAGEALASYDAALALAAEDAATHYNRRNALMRLGRPACSLRNLGGAVGIAALQTFLTKREQFHSNVPNQSVSLFEQATRARIDELSRYFLSHGVTDHAEAWHQAVVAIGRTVRQQAYIMAFSDTFYLLGAALVVALIATLLLKKPDQPEVGGAH
jgi:tetratricopeptide (TPR) repeat protein